MIQIDFVSALTRPGLRWRVYRGLWRQDHLANVNGQLPHLRGYDGAAGDPGQLRGSDDRLSGVRLSLIALSQSNGRANHGIADADRKGKVGRGRVYDCASPIVSSMGFDALTDGAELVVDVDNPGAG